MPIELYVLLPSSNTPKHEEWQVAIDRLKLPLNFIELVDLHSVNLLQISIDNRNIDIHFHVLDQTKLTAEFKDTFRTFFSEKKLSDFVVYSLGYGDDLYESAAAFYSAAALVGKFDGIAMEPEGDFPVGFDSLIETAKLVFSLDSRGFDPSKIDARGSIQ